ncbi:Lrp/AsnC family transcriptional regulator [Amycolatopsis sp. NPDC059021]|uniref:Lrp/AsnC family transcriptional regulator n=1 Tax=Amycolatopsis sp. NPDC059021 TaxID=3346704 RepID=UPI00366B95A8
MSRQVAHAPESGPSRKAPPESALLTELDLALVEALQVDPRAPWTRIGTAIGVDATTAARRWERLTSAGLAWLTAYVTVPTLTVGYLDIACRPEALTALTERLCGWQCVFNLERTTGRYQLFLGVSAHGLAGLDRLIARRVAELGGVTAVRLAVATRVYREGSGWLVHTLTPQQRAVLDDTAERARLVVPARWNDTDFEALVHALGADGRRSFAELARDCGMSESAVRRRLARMLVDHELDFRCDLAHGVAGWPVIGGYRLDVPGDRLDEVGRVVAALPETRLCAAVAGEHNLVLSTWFRAPSGCLDFEATLAARLPGVRIAERSITTKMPKRMGRLLDANGVARGQVPMTPAP